MIRMIRMILQSRRLPRGGRSVRSRTVSLVLISLFLLPAVALAGSDCNDNGVADHEDIAGGASLDVNGNGVPDECEPDCNLDGRPDRASTGGTRLVSASALDGTPGAGRSHWTRISADGSVVAFISAAPDLDPLVADPIPSNDAFVLDRASGTIEQVSVLADGSTGGGRCLGISTSADGRFVAFHGRSRLLAGLPSDASNVYLRDRLAGTTEVLTVTLAGGPHEAIQFDVGGSSITPDGRYVAFDSAAGDLVPGDTNGVFDVFVRDRLLGTTERVSVSSSGIEGNGWSVLPVISPDGRWVAFESTASTLVPGDANGSTDVFLHDRASGQTIRVSERPDGALHLGSSGWPRFAPDHTRILFHSGSPDLTDDDFDGAEYDLFIRDLAADTIERLDLSGGTGSDDRDLWYPSISADGRFVIALTPDDDLARADDNGRWDIVVLDRRSGETRLLTVDGDGAQHLPGGFYVGQGFAPWMSADGSLVTFSSDAPNLAAGDDNLDWDVFLARVLQPCDDPMVADQAPPGGDGRVDCLDLLLVLEQWGAGGRLDVDVAPAGGDGVVDVLDLLAVLAAWTDG